MKRYSWLWPTIIIISTLAVGFVNSLSRELVLRPIIVMWFLLVCPGMMLGRFLRLREPAVEWTLALALSLSIDAILAGIQLYAGRWSPTATLAILIYLCLGGSFIQIAIPRSVG